MNRHGMRFGLISCLFAAAAIVLAVTGHYFSSIQGAVGGYVLQWFDGHGFVRPPNLASYPAWTTPSPLVITDSIATRWLAVHACWFAACAMLLALWAEYRRETTLLLSAGFVLGGMALVFLSPVTSICAMLGGGACMAWFRHSIHHKDTT